MAETYLNLDDDTRLYTPQTVIPPRDHLRPAWRWPAVGNEIVIDLPAGRDAVREYLRGLREAEWPWVDAERAKATDTDDAERLAAVRAYAQKLRDAPDHASIAAARTAEALRAITLQSTAGDRP